jgi:hypothetical protein
MAADRFSLLLESRTTGTQEIAKLEDALRRVADVAEKSGKRTSDSTKKAADDVRGSLDKLKGVIANPFEQATQGAEDFALSFGRAGVVAVGATAALAGAATAIFSLANSTQNLAEQQTNSAQILGLSIKDYGLFDQAAKNASVSTELLTGTMRQLAKGLSDSSEEGKQAKRALAELGVSGTDIFGAVRPTKDLLLEIADALGRIENPAARADAAMKVLGRGGIALIPLLNSNLRETVQELERLGVGFDEAGANKANKFGDQLDLLDTKFAALKNKIGLLSIDLINFLNIDTLKGTAQKSAELDAAAALARNQLELNAANRSGSLLSLSNDQLRGARLSGNGDFGAGLNPFPELGLSSDQLQSSLNTGAKQIIRKLIAEKDTESRLTAARNDLTEAVRNDDIAGVKLSQAKISRLEKQIESEKKDKTLRDKLATFQLPDKLGVNVNSSTRVPSLLSGRERVLRGGAIGGDFTLDQGAFDAANAGRQANALEQVRARGEAIEARRLDTRQRELTALDQAVELESRRIALIAGPGGELDTINQTTALRLSSLERQLDLGRSLADVEIERTRIVKERELEILSLKKQQREEGRNTATSLFDAAVSGGQGLRSFITSTALSIPRTIAGNLGAELGGTTGKLSLGLGGVAGRLLRGTPFGADPLKEAGNVQMTAAQIQLQAAQIQAGTATGGGGGSFGSLLGGVTSNPLIFNAIGGGGLAGLPSSRGTRNLDIASMIYGVPLNTGGPRGSGLSRGVGIAGGLAAGAFGAYSGFSAGGAQGALTGTASIAGAAAGILPLISTSLAAAGPIGGIAALALMGAAAIIGNPKERESRRIDQMLESSRFTEASGRNYVADVRGGSVEYDRTGGMRVTYVYYQPQVSAIDQRGVSEFFEGNKHAMTRTIAHAVNNGDAGDMLDTLRQNI